MGTSTMTRNLPNDVARCPGDYHEDGGWREGCEDCARRLSPVTGERSINMAPPAIIAFWCEFHIPAQGATGENQCATYTDAGGSNSEPHTGSNNAAVQRPPGQ